ncbi:Uncharacterised protein [Streptococcus pneumoniae]|nr:Uncharacterised protein [Streptococcus pneumoniae]COT19251.1 Uncharacterised protein [Streptococcus pneumoniae]
MAKLESKPTLPHTVTLMLLHKFAQNVISQRPVYHQESLTYLFLHLYGNYKYPFHPNITLYYAPYFVHTVKRTIHAHPIPIHLFVFLYPLLQLAYLLHAFVFLIAHIHNHLQNIIDLLPLFLHTSSSHCSLYIYIHVSVQNRRLS